MHKSLKSASLILIIVFFLSTNFVFAENTNSIIDPLGYLSPTDIATLQSSLEEIQQKFALDVVIVITDDVEGKTSMAFSDDYYDYNGYGLGNDSSGLLLLINMADREVWISTYARAHSLFVDQRIEQMIGQITTDLANDNYFSACDSFLNRVSYYAEQGVPSDVYFYDQKEPVFYTESTYGERALKLLYNPVVYLVALIISLAATYIITQLNKGIVTINYETYELKDSFQLAQQEDIFLREHVTKTKIVKSDSSGSGSGSHTSSSGRSHGGGGGKF